MLKKILIGIVAVIVLLVLVAFMLPSKIDVSKSISVNAPAAYVYEEVNELRNWPAWSYWQAQDTSMQLTYGAVTSGANASYSWVSSDGPGSLAFTENTPDKAIKFDLRFMEEGDAAKGWYTFEPEGDSTKLTCGLVFDHGLNPISRWFGFLLIEPEMKKAFEYELVKIKQLAEAKPKFTVAISEVNAPAVYYVGIKTTMSPQDQLAINAQMAKSFDELMAMLAKSKVQMQGHPFCLYPSYSDTSMDMICAIPVTKDAKTPLRFPVGEVAQTLAVKAIHKGDYAKMMDTHLQLDAYVKFKKLEMNGAPWESYLTDPFEVKDTAQWITEIYYPVKK